MKKNDWIFLGTVLIYSLLFYKQMPGLNFLLMNIVLIIGTIAMDKPVLQNRNWMFSAIGALASSLCVFMYGDLLSIAANFISILMMSAFAMNPKNSVITSIFQSFLSVLTSFAFMIDDGIKRKRKRMESQLSSSVRWNRVIISLVAFLVVIFFFILYRQSNTLFCALTEKIDLSFISPGWLFFTAIGFFVMYGYYYHHSIEQLSEWEGGISLQLIPAEKPSFLDSLMSLSSEKFSAIVLLVMLNVMVAVVNFLDLSFIFSGGKSLPNGANYSEYVHQGVGVLIFSIICAMLIILYYFRGRMNFIANSKPLRILALIWIAQNSLMLFSTLWRNGSYVRAYGLTYMRIGVYVYLILALIGLITMAWKVIDKRSNAFLFKANSWLFYLVFIIAGFVNWDAFITKFNLSLKQEFDIDYFSDLSFRNYDQVIDYYQQHPSEFVNAQFDRHLYRFMSGQRYVQENSKWPSSVMAAKSIYNAIKDKDMNRNIRNDDIEMNNCDLKKLYYFPAFENTERIMMQGNDLTDLGEVSKYRKLVELSVMNNHDLTSIDGIQNCKELTTFSFDADKVKDFSPLFSLPNLSNLNADHLPDDIVRQLKQHYPNLSIDTHLFSEWL